MENPMDIQMKEGLENWKSQIKSHSHQNLNKSFLKIILKWRNKFCQVLRTDNYHT